MRVITIESVTGLLGAPVFGELFEGRGVV